MEDTDTEDKLISETNTNPSSPSSPLGSLNRLRSAKAKLRKMDEGMEKVRQQLASMESARQVLETEKKTEELALKKRMEGNVNQHLAILVKLAGMDLRTPDGSLNSRRNDLNEALIVGCLVRIKSDMEDDPSIKRLMVEAGKRMLAERARNRGKKK